MGIESSYRVCDVYNELMTYCTVDRHDIYVQNGKGDGYWSNLDQDSNRKMLENLGNQPVRDIIRQHYPHLESIIFSASRVAGLEYLNLKGDEICIDYGCMWGAISVPLAQRTQAVIGIDQTHESLRFLNQRILESNIHNLHLLNHDVKALPVLENKVDVSIVNGVLEWIPETGVVELNNYYGKFKKRRYTNRPDQDQLSFLRRVHTNLNASGKLYLAIENRFDIKQFFGAKDPHANIRFTSILPRFLANIISKLFLGRPYMNWLYSFRGIKKLLRDAGFSRVELYACFPHYHSPTSIIPYDSSFYRHFDASSIGLKASHRFRSKLRVYIQTKVYIFLFKVLRLKFFSPSIIAIAHK